MKTLLCALMLLVFMAPMTVEAFTLNVTSDIHAGKQKTRDYRKYTPGNVIYPKKGEAYFKNFLQAKGDIYLALGDNSNTCKDASKYDKKLAKSVAKSGNQAYFGFGNHDCDKGYKYLSSAKHYTVDKGDWRIIVLNSEEVDGGGFSSSQLDWFEKQLDTDKHVVVAASKPAFQKDLTTPKEGTFSRFLKIIGDHKNVKHVLGGDYHVFHETKEIDNVKYHFVQALTLKSAPGRFLKLELE